MSQKEQIVDTLKLELKRHQINYRQVAEKIGLSEASVKRLFSENSFTLDRLEQICQMMHLEISELIEQMESNLAKTAQLTLEQETELVSDVKLVIMAHFLMNRLKFEEIIDIYDISETEGFQLLYKLQEMKILEIQPPGNRVRLMVSKHFRYIPGGPIERFYTRHLQSEFLDSKFKGHGEHRTYLSGMFSRDANAEIIRKMDRLAEDIKDLRDASDRLPLGERFGCSLIMAIRPWEPKVFEQLRRAPNVKKF